VKRVRVAIDFGKPGSGGSTRDRLSKRSTHPGMKRWNARDALYFALAVPVSQNRAFPALSMVNGSGHHAAPVNFPDRCCLSFYMKREIIISYIRSRNPSLAHKR